MGVKTVSSPFGGQGRTRVLLALRLLGDSYPRELARVLGSPLSNVQKALASLELDGLVAGGTNAPVPAQSPILRGRHPVCLPLAPE